MLKRIITLLIVAVFTIPTADANTFDTIKALAESGHAKAQHVLGTMYKYGQGTQQDAVQAVYWWKQSAENGNTDGMADLGIFLYDHKNKKQQGLKWLAKASAKGNGKATFKIAKIYEHKNNLQQAIFYFKKAYLQRTDELAKEKKETIKKLTK